MQQKSWTRLLAIGCALCLILAVFAGCGARTAPASSAETAAGDTIASAPEQETPETVAEPEAAAPEPEAADSAAEEAPEEPDVPEEPAYFPLEETKSFNYWFVYPPFFEGFAEGPQDYLMYTEAEQRLNVSIDFTAIPIPGAAEQFMLMIASGDYNDVILYFPGSYSGSLDEAIDQEIIIDLTEPLEQYAPDYLATQGKSETRVLGSYTEAGRQAAIYGFQTDDGRIPKFGPVIRQDWLDELGLQAPVTVEEYHDVLAAFRDEKGATSAYGLAADGVTTPGNMQGAYGIVVPSNNDANGFFQVDGKVRFGPVEEGFREMLTTLNQWYSEGLIDSNFVSDTSSATSGEVDSSRIASGAVGLWRGYATNLSNYEDNIGGGAKVTGIPQMKKNAGDTLHFGLDTDGAAANMSVSVSTACEDVELVVRFFNYYFTEEGSLLANYGTEGFTFEYNDKGDPVYTEVITANPQGMTMDVALALYTGGTTGGPYEIDNSKNYYSYTEAQMSAGNAWKQDSDGAYQLPATYSGLLNAAEQEELDSLYNDIVTTYRENVLQFIIGQRPLSEFDDFRNQLEEMGIARCIEIEQGALDRYYARAES